MPSAISSDVVSLELINLNSTTFHFNNFLPMAIIVRICQKKDFPDCQQSPMYREVLGLYSVFKKRSFAKTSQDLTGARIFARLIDNKREMLHAVLSAYNGQAGTEQVIHWTRFDTRLPIDKKGATSIVLI